jgi:hypothetical protein
MPRPPDQPVVQEDAAENATRERRTLRELVAEAHADGQTDFSYPSESLDLDAVIERIGPERWAFLRARRDEILAQLREHREED